VSLRTGKCELHLLTHHSGVLGCTGSVGQRFILLLADHPNLILHAIGASSRSAGKAYKDAVRWKQSKPMSKGLSGLVVRECKALEFKDCDLVFSGLDSDVAGEIGKLPCRPFQLHGRS
jgi:aspartate-semialdehyde dehydrogenase